MEGTKLPPHQAPQSFCFAYQEEHGQAPGTRWLLTGMIQEKQTILSSIIGEESSRIKI
jgi:hypothetical protein